MGVGRQVVGTIGQSNSLSADGRPLRRLGATTVDWSTVAAVTGSDVVLSDGQVIKVGEKYLKVGQVLCQITTGGKYGPYDFAAVDGRATVARSKCCIVDRVAVNTEPLDEFPSVLIGGVIWKERLVATAGTHSLANGPTFTELEAALPQLEYAVTA